MLWIWALRESDKESAMRKSELTLVRCWASQPTLKSWWAKSTHWAQGRALCYIQPCSGRQGLPQPESHQPRKHGGHILANGRGQETQKGTKPPPNTSIFFSSLICFANWQCQVARATPWKSNPFPQFPISLLMTKTLDNEQNF